ncbi:isopeptide-forming domain-containing fimbrial protein, partial [Hoeflea marina]
MRRFAGLLFAVLLCCGAGGQARAQSASCTPDMYQSDGQSSLQPTFLRKGVEGLGTFDFALVPGTNNSQTAAGEPVTYNALGYNPVDDKLYAIRGGDEGRTNVDPGDNGKNANAKLGQLLIISKTDGSVTVVDARAAAGDQRLENLHATDGWVHPIVGGAFDPAGTYYLSYATSSHDSGGRVTKLMRIVDLAGKVADRQAGGANLGVVESKAVVLPSNLDELHIADMAWSNGSLLAVTVSEANKRAFLIKIDPRGWDTGLAPLVTILGPSGSSDNGSNPLHFGALYGFANGLYGSDNSERGFFRIHTQDETIGERSYVAGEVERRSSSNDVKVNDGANCLFANAVFHADIEVTKTNTPGQNGDVDLPSDTYSPGLRTYTMEISNLGPSRASDVQVVDTLPVGVPLDSALQWTCAPAQGAGNTTEGTIPSCGSVTSGSGVIDHTIDLPAGTSVKFTQTMRVPVDYAGDLTNTVTATILSSDLVDPVLSNNTAVDTDQPLVGIRKQLTGETGGLTAGVAEPGEDLTYQITLTNAGSAAVTGYNLTDVLDKNLTLQGPTVPAASSVTAGPGVGETTILWTGLTIPAAINATTPGTLVLSVTARVDNPVDSGVNEVINYTHRTEDPSPDCIGAGRDGPLCVITPTQQSRLSKVFVSDTGIANLAEPGDVLTYNVSVINDGDTEINGFVLRDVFFPASAVASINAPGGTSVIDVSGANTAVTTWTIASVPAHTTATRTIAVTLTDPLIGAGPNGEDIGKVGNLVGELPCVPGSEKCPEPIPTEPHITPVKTLTAESIARNNVAQAGETLTYTITLTNRGGKADTDYTLVDVLGPNLTFVPGSVTIGGAAAGGGQVNVSGQTITVGPLTVPAAAVDAQGLVTQPAVVVLTLQATVADPIPDGVSHVLNHTFHSTDTPPTCLPAGTSTDLCVYTPTPPKISTSKALTGESITVNNIAQVGETLTYTLTVINNGGTGATNYVLRDLFTPVSAIAAMTSPDADFDFAYTGTGEAAWTIATIPAGGSVTRTISVTLTAPLPAGLVEVRNSVTTDCTVTNAATGEPCDVVTPTEASISTSKLLTSDAINNDGIADPGDTLTYTISITNTGGSAALNYMLKDVFSPVAAVSGIASTDPDFVSGNIATGESVWTIGSIAAGATVTRTVSITLKAPLPAGLTRVRNSVTTDCTVTNAVTGEPCDVFTPTPARISTAKLLTGESNLPANNIAEPGETLTYTISVTNSGGDEVSSYELKDVFSPLSALAGLASPDADFVGGSVATGQSTWLIASVPANSTVTRTISVTLKTPLPAGLVAVRNSVTTDCTVTDVATGVPCDVVTPTPPMVTFGKVLEREEDGHIFGVAEPDEQLDYVITLTNTGGTPATNYSISDRFYPFSLQTFADSQITGVYDPATGTYTWTGLTVPAQVGNIPGELRLTLYSGLKSAFPANLAKVKNLVFDPSQPPVSEPLCPTTDVLVCTPTPPVISTTKALLAESNAPANGVAEPGETLTYQITVSNSGGTAKADYSLVDVLGPNLAFVPGSVTIGGVAAAPGQVSVSGQTITVEPFAVPVGTIVDRTVTVPGQIVVTLQAKVAAPIPANVTEVRNTVVTDCAVTDTATGVPCVVVLPTTGQIQTSKLLTGESNLPANGIAEPGETLTFTLTVTNTGGSTVSGYVLEDAFTPVEAIASISSPDVNFDGGDTATGLSHWTMTLPAGTTKTRTILITLKDPLPAGLRAVKNTVTTDCIITDAVTGAPCEVNPPTPPKVSTTKVLTS